MSGDLSNLKPYTATERYDDRRNLVQNVFLNGSLIISTDYIAHDKLAALLNDAYQAGIKKGRETGTLTMQDVLPSESQVVAYVQPFPSRPRRV